MFDWSRTPIRVEVNSGVIRITPLPLRNDRVLSLRSSFPILADVSRLLLFDLLELHININFTRSLLIDEPNFFIETTKLHNNTKYFDCLINSRFVSSEESSFIFSLLNSLESAHSCFLTSLNVFSSFRSTLNVFLDQLFFKYTCVSNKAMQHTYTYLSNHILFYKPSSLSATKVGRFLSTKEFGKWEFSMIDSIFRTDSTVRLPSVVYSNIKDLMSTSVVFTELENSNTVTLLSLFRCTMSSIPFVFNLLIIKSLVTLFYSLFLDFKESSPCSTTFGLLQKSLFDETTLTLASIVYSSKTSDWAAQNQTNNFHLFLVNNQV